MKRFAAGIRSAFPDLNYTVDDIFAEGDRVAARITGRGTHRGSWELLPLPPTGRTVTWTEMHICRIADGRSHPASSAIR